MLLEPLLRSREGVGSAWRPRRGAIGAKPLPRSGALAAAASRPCALDRQVADVTHESRQEPTKT